MNNSRNIPTNILQQRVLPTNIPLCHEHWQGYTDKHLTLSYVLYSDSRVIPTNIPLCHDHWQGYTDKHLTLSYVQ
jgi:hypothetical protein